MTLLNEFRDDIRKAINAYLEESNTTIETLPIHRRYVCNNLYQYTLDRTINWVNLRKIIFEAISELETGVLFFQTGRSLLKTKINAVLSNPKYSEMAFLRDENNELRAILKNLKYQKFDNTIINLLHAEIEKLREESNGLKEKLKKHEEGTAFIENPSTLTIHNFLQQP